MRGSCRAAPASSRVPWLAAEQELRLPAKQGSTRIPSLDAALGGPGFPSRFGQFSLATRLKMLLSGIPLFLPIHPVETLVPTTAFGSLKLPLNREP